MCIPVMGGGARGLGICEMRRWLFQQKWHLPHSLVEGASEASGGVFRKERACVRAICGYPELTG